MARCEDFPCCGHESGCCPDFDESGRQLNMICTCGAKLPVGNRVSICDGCLNNEEDDDRWCDDRDEVEDDDFDDSMDGDNASALASAGYGTDEDYGGGSHYEDHFLDSSWEME